MGIRPNGDMTPCPYLPSFAGNVRTERIADLWSDAPLFREIRKRDELGGRCGTCEFSSACGGCRARAWATTEGQLLAEDPLCSYEPGAHPQARLLLKPALSYGEPAQAALAWEPEAEARMKKIPAFVRGMVVKAVEDRCRKDGLALVTTAALDEIRARMPVKPPFAVRG
jgi:radical SAM protein with 4Fe4S-binding SPASM domain